MNRLILFKSDNRAGDSSVIFLSGIRVIRSSRRRTLQIRVTPQGVEARAPARMPESDIADFISRKKAWIDKARQEMSERPGQQPDIFSKGGVFHVLGEPYQLEVKAVDLARSTLEESEQGWRVSMGRDGEQGVCRLLMKWYRLKAEALFLPWLEAWARRMGLECPRLVLRDQTRIWGSYSARTRTVSLNWRLVAFPSDLVSYVIVHELCHIRHLNHSPKFWREVGIYCPGWKEQRKMLRFSSGRFIPDWAGFLS